MKQLLWLLAFCFCLVASPVMAGKKMRHKHDLEVALTAANDHTGVDSGFAPEIRYGYRYKRSVSLLAGFKWAPEGFGNYHRMFLLGRVHLPLFPRSDMNFQFGWLHTAFHGLKKGENLLLLLHEFNGPYFLFHGGVSIRFLNLTADSYTNPFKASTRFIEAFFLFDVRGQYTFRFPRLGGASLQLGAGLMNFLLSDIYNANNVGYQLAATWKQPGVGEFGLQVGTRSYSWWALAGYFGRFFVFFSYKARFQH
jgi:hypothetical protein